MTKSKNVSKLNSISLLKLLFEGTNLKGVGILGSLSGEFVLLGEGINIGRTKNDGQIIPWSQSTLDYLSSLISSMERDLINVYFTGGSVDDSTSIIDDEPFNDLHGPVEHEHTEYEVVEHEDEYDIESRF